MKDQLVPKEQICRLLSSVHFLVAIKRALKSVLLALNANDVVFVE